MTGTLVFLCLAQWHSVVLDTFPSIYILSPSVLLLNSDGYPIVIYKRGPCDTLEIVSWTGSEWERERPLYGYEFPGIRDKAYLDSVDHLWIAYSPGVGADGILIPHRTDVGWDTLLFPDTISQYSYGFLLDSVDVSHLFYVNYNENDRVLRHACHQEDTVWVRETLAVFSGFPYSPVAGMASCSLAGILYYAYVTLDLLICGQLENGAWSEDTVDDVAGLGDFAMSGVEIAVDRWSLPHLRYAPYYYDVHGYKQKYAYRDTSGWHVEFIHGEYDQDPFYSLSVAIDSLGVVHRAKYDSTGVYRMVHYQGDTLWYEAELIDTFPDACCAQMVIDDQGYFHIVFNADDRHKLIYATTNPDIGVSESLPEPKPGLSLSVAPNPAKGLLKLQFGIPLEDEGLISLKIYDVSGRAVQTVFSEEKGAGYYDLSVPTSSFQAGTYFLRLEAGTKAITEKIILR